MFVTKWYVIKGWWYLSSEGHCVPYGLVVLLTKEYGDIGMAYGWDIGVHRYGISDSHAEHSAIKSNLQSIWA